MEYELQLIEREPCHHGFLTLARYRLRHALFRGGMSQVLARERIEPLEAAAILLYDPATEQVVMVEQFRIGALEAQSGAWLTEPVGGMVGPGESPIDVARREADEEAGCQVSLVEPMCRFYVSPGVSGERVHLFCGCCAAPADGGIHGLAHEGEDIRVVVLEVAEAFRRVTDGRIQTTTGIIAVQWLALHHQRLRRIWLGQ